MTSIVGRGVKLDGREQKIMLYAVRMSESVEELQDLVREFGRICNKRKLKVTQSQRMVVLSEMRDLECKIYMNGERLARIRVIT